MLAGLFILLTFPLCFTQSANAETCSIGTVLISPDLTSSNAFNVFSPQAACYNKSSIHLNFSLTAHSIGTISYTLDDQEIQSIQTNYVKSKGNNYDAPFLNSSSDNQVTVMGDLVFDNLPNGNHTLRLFIGSRSPLGCYVVEGFTEVNFSVKAPNVLLVQKEPCYSCDVPLQLFVSEPARLLCCVDNRANDTIHGNTTLTGLGKGCHNVTVYASNEAGYSSASNTIKFEVLQDSAPNSSADNNALINSDCPFVQLFIIFMVLIFCMFPVIKYLEKRANAENIKT